MLVAAGGSSVYENSAVGIVCYRLCMAFEQCVMVLMCRGLSAAISSTAATLHELYCCCRWQGAELVRKFPADHLAAAKHQCSGGCASGVRCILHHLYKASGVGVGKYWHREIPLFLHVVPRLCA